MTEYFTVIYVKVYSGYGATNFETIWHKNSGVAWRGYLKQVFSFDISTYQVIDDGLYNHQWLHGGLRHKNISCNLKYKILLWTKSLFNYMWKDARPVYVNGTPLCGEAFWLFLQVVARNEISLKLLLTCSQPHSYTKDMNILSQYRKRKNNLLLWPWQLRLQTKIEIFFSARILFSVPIFFPHIALSTVVIFSLIYCSSVLFHCLSSFNFDTAHHLYSSIIYKEDIESKAKGTKKNSQKKFRMQLFLLLLL